MLTLVQQPRDRVADARELLYLIETTRPAMWLLYGLLPLLLGVGLVVAGLLWGGLLIGAPIGWALLCHGPAWWPGRR